MTAVFVLSGTRSSGTPSIAEKARTWGVDPIGQRLRPAGAGEREARRAENGDKESEPRALPRSADQITYGHGVAGVIANQPLAGGIEVCRIVTDSVFETKPR